MGGGREKTRHRTKSTPCGSQVQQGISETGVFRNSRWLGRRVKGRGVVGELPSSVLWADKWIHAEQTAQTDPASLHSGAEAGLHTQKQSSQFNRICQTGFVVWTWRAYLLSHSDSVSSFYSCVEFDPLLSKIHNV